ncbi:hypothetical protein B0O99DRAFT_592606 [Bisporella sp. PMI_857]|nr:hypothetical protein B0O99DRAFT_592606 [Bisporella sp. PMI_857]
MLSGEKQLKMSDESDLSRPTVSRQAKSGYPIILPWTAEPLPLGTSFESALSHTINPFLKTNAFDPASLCQARFLYTKDGGTASYASTSTTSSGTSNDHMSVSLGVTVGCPFLNASVTGSYDKDVLENNDALKTSLKTSYHRGTIIFSQPIPFSNTALADLKIMGGFPRFRAIYGDFYVAGFNLGGDTSVLLSQSSDSKVTTEILAVTLKVHVLWFDKSKKWENVSQTVDAHASYSVTGFDTLSNSYVKLSSATRTNIRDVREMCLNLSSLGENLQGRVEAKMQQLKLEEGILLSWADCERILRQYTEV